jgi:hypothetical protein
MIWRAPRLIYYSLLVVFFAVWRLLSQPGRESARQPSNPQAGGG